MILQEGHSLQYLMDLKDGKIPNGLGINCNFDNHFVWKDSELNIILGHDNVGKTYFIEWYFLCLSVIHDQSFTILMDENHSGKVMRDLIQMYKGEKFERLTHNEIRILNSKFEQKFKFLDNKKRYEPNQLLDLFTKTDTTNYLIDPFNALKTPMSYSENYEVLNNIKLFNKNHKKTVFINAHPNSNSGRRSAVFPDKHDWGGHVMPPLKSDIEGGKPFANKADNFLVCHRLTQHELMWNFTMIDVVKVKDTDTGGKPTKLNTPIMFDYNFGLGFKCEGVNPLSKEPLPKQLSDFNELKKENDIKMHQAVNNINITPEKSLFEEEYGVKKDDILPF